MSLKPSQKNEILRALAEQGIDPHRFTWGTLSKVDQPTQVDFPKGALVCSYHGDPWYLAISDEGKSWRAWWAPSAQCSTWTLSANSFASLMSAVVRPWVVDLKHQLQEPELWSSASRAAECRKFLLPSQQNEFYRALQKQGLQESAVWSEISNKVRLTISQGNFTFSIAWAYESQYHRHVWKGSRSPGSERPSESYEYYNWSEVVKLADRWAADVAHELREMNIPIALTSEAKVVSADRLIGLRLQNIRSFRDFYFPFRNSDDSPRMLTLLIGENGTCKTTLLRSIALVLCGRTDANLLLSKPLGQVLGKRGKGQIVLEYLTPEGELRKRTIEIARNGPREEIVSEDGEVPLLFAYASGVGRTLESADVPTPSDYRLFQSLVALFDYTTPTANPELVLRRLRDSRRDEFQSILQTWIAALGLPEGSLIQIPPAGGVEVSLPGLPTVPLQALGDGYRLTLGWFLDLFAWATAAGQPYVHELSGILLVDEVERHLHPSLQSTVLKRLRQTYPQLQLIATTHSPLAALGASTGELFVAEADADGLRFVPGPVMEGMSVEDLVTNEEAFDSVAYAPDVAELLEEYDRLSAKLPEDRNDLEKKRLAQLSAELTQVFSSEAT